MKILVAEDDFSLRRALGTILQKNNFSVDAVDNGGDALEYLLSGIYDAAVLDIMMPVCDGITVLAKARQKHISTPVLLLMRNPRRIIPQSHILENIWDPDSRAEDNTVWTYISYLRKKLAAIGSDLKISTMRGAGYILEADRT